MHPAASRRRLVSVAALGAAVIALGPWLAFHSAWGPPSEAQVGWLAAEAVVGAAWLAAALASLHEDPAGPMWRILLAYVAASAIWTLEFVPAPAIVWTLGTMLVNLDSPVLVHALVAFPSGRLSSRLDRRLVATAYGLWLATAVVGQLTWDPAPGCDPICVQNVFFAWHSDAVSRIVQGVSLVAVPLLGIAAAAVVLGHWRSGTPSARRLLLPAAMTAPVAVAVSVVGYTGDNLGIAWLSSLARHPVFLMIDAVPAVGMLIGFARARLDRGRIADLIVDLAGGVPLGSLEERLRQALRDPGVRLLFPSPEGPGLVDAGGRPAESPRPDARVAVVEVMRGEELLAVIAHDASLDRESPGLVSSVVAAARLAVENERLSAQVRAQLDEVRASRLRIVEAGDAERRRVERDLHDGAQQRLVALTMRLEAARGGTPDAERIIDQATTELAEAIAEVRSLSRGLHPAVLTEAGLLAAIESLAERTPFPVRVEGEDRRFPPPVEAAAYFVVAEALTNVARHAAATGATVKLSSSAGELIVEVADDGRGGAEPARGSGLRGLEDRVAAAGGHLEVRSSTSAGTMVRAAIPVSVGSAAPARQVTA